MFKVKFDCLQGCFRKQRGGRTFKPVNPKHKGKVPAHNDSQS